MNIFIKTPPSGVFGVDYITVQSRVVVDESGTVDLVYCNHAGSYLDESVEYCDKCIAHRFNKWGETEEWQDAPERGER